MRRLNFHVNSKILSIVLCVILVCVFTLTIAYAALSAVLTISGSAEVVASNWNIHLENARVISGSVSNNAPSINGNTLSFSAHLDVPGDYYEFVVDVVNDGSIDAMIDSIVVTPTLTDSQKKYLKYEVSYQNGEDVSTKQVLYSGSTMPITVRVEYIRDLVKGDLPTEDTVLNSSLTLVYSQSDGSGSGVINDGHIVPVANGDIDTIGTVVTIGTEKFYVIGSNTDTVKLFAMHNLYVSGYYKNGTIEPYGEKATGKQDPEMKGMIDESKPRNGITPFSSSTQKGEKNSSYVGSIVESYINNYSDILLNEYGIVINEARAITYDELTDTNTFKCTSSSCFKCPYEWIYSSTYWTSTAKDDNYVWRVGYGGIFFASPYNLISIGVRPVIVISKDYF